MTLEQEISNTNSPHISKPFKLEPFDENLEALYYQTLIHSQKGDCIDLTSRNITQFNSCLNAYSSILDQHFFEIGDKLLDILPQINLPSNMTSQYNNSYEKFQDKKNSFSINIL